jgi:hypothetical protein
MKRQRGRNRGGNSGGGGGGGKPQQHNVNRAFDSNGPDNVKVRGNAQHVFEKYQQLARDATSSGDRVLAENYLQHAEHYFRVVRAVTPNRAVSDIIGRDAFSSGYDIDFEDEIGAQAQADEQPAEGSDSNTQQHDNNGAGEGGEQRAERQDRDQWRDRRDERPRDERSRDDRQRDDRPRQDRDDYRPRNNDGQQPRADGQPRNNDDRPPRRDRDRFRDRDRDRDRPRDPMAVIEPEGGAVVAAAPVEDAGPRLRSQDGSESHAPAFLQARPPAAERPEAAADEGEAKKPRRRRAPRGFEGGEGQTAPSESEEV